MPDSNTDNTNEPVGDLLAYLVAHAESPSPGSATPRGTGDSNAASWRATEPAEGQSDGDRNRPIIEITTDEMTVNDLAVAALAADPTVYTRGGVLVHVIPDEGDDCPRLIWRPKGSPRIVPIPNAVLRELFAAAAEWCKRSKKGKLVAAHPPTWAVNAVQGRGHWPEIRPLSGVVSGPTLRLDGTILSESGYDPSTGLICQSSLEMPEIPERPTLEQVHHAVECLRDSVIDFPFAAAEHFATWLAFLLTMLARFAFPGVSPLFLFDANVAGAGKNLLCDLAAVIVTGRTMPRMSNPTNDDEARKRITAIGLGGDPNALIDNVDGNLGSPSLDAALTSTVWKDRILGRSEMVELPLVVTWCATGNNVMLAKDMPRRTAHIRLLTMEERPEERRQFRHENLLDWAQQERGRLVGAALTILRGYCEARRPPQTLIPWGSFEGWSDLVRGAIVWAGLPDPALTRQGLIESNNTEGQALAALLTGLRLFDPAGDGRTVSEIIRCIAEPRTANSEAAEMILESLSVLCQSKAGGLPSTQSIGMKFHHLRRRVVGGKYLDRYARNNTAAWLVRDVTQGTTGTTPILSCGETFHQDTPPGDSCQGTRGTSGTIPNPSHERLSHEDAQAGNSGNSPQIAGAATTPLRPPSPLPDSNGTDDPDVEVF